eukprot:918610-Pelagomonas_calceolata.AAC.1
MHTNISESLNSLHQKHKQLNYPEKHKQHVQGDVLHKISTLISNSRTNIVYKVKSHAGIAGNECADAVGKYQANQAHNSVADTGISSAGPGGNPFSHMLWLAREEKRELTPAHPLLYPVLKSPTFPIIRMIHAYKTHTWLCQSQKRLLLLQSELVTSC